MRGDDAKILVFPWCASVPSDVSTDEHMQLLNHCQTEVVYELGRSLSEGHLQIFNDGGISDEYPLPELSTGKHVTDLPHGFYWKENRESFPDPLLSCTLGKRYITIGADSLWAEDSDPSAYDYKPGHPREKYRDPPADLAANLEGEDVGFEEWRIPARQNLGVRLSGQLPEIQLLGVGFTESTLVECGRGQNPEQFGKAPLRDIRVVSTVEHDMFPEIQALQAARFTVPAEVFEYPHHVRIVGKLK